MPRGAFKPAPKVDSAVLSIQGISGKAFESEAEERWFFEVLRAGFAHKRKQLAKNLEAVAPREQVRSALESLSLPEKVRAEDLLISDWLALARALSH